MIAYLILIHRYPEQFKRLFKAIYHPGNHYLIHVDKSSGKEIRENLQDFLGNYQNAELLEPQNAVWGGYSLVDIELRGMARLLEMDKHWTHFVNLSGQDFPLKTQRYMQNFLSDHRCTEFIRVLDQQQIRPDTMHRVADVCFELGNYIYRPNWSRKFLKGVTPYIGTQWMIVSRRFCQFVTGAKAVHRYTRFYRNTFIADEGFFQTVMMNNDCHGKIVKDDMRLIDWVPDGDIKLRPRTFGRADAKQLITSKCLFARKFDSTVDDDILGELELHLTAGSKVKTKVRPLANH